MIPQYGHSERVRSVAFSSDGSLIASGGSEASVKLWNRDGILLRTIPGTGHRYVHSLVFNPNNRYLVAGLSFGEILIFDLESGKHISWIANDKETANGSHQPIEQNHILCISVRADGEYFVTGSSRGWIAVFRFSGERLASFKAQNEAVNHVVFAADGTTFFSASDDGSVKQWYLDGRERRTISDFAVPVRQVKRIAISPTGDSIAFAAIGDSKSIIEVRTLGTDQVSRRYEINRKDFATLSFTQDGTGLFVVAGTTGAVDQNIDKLDAFRHLFVQVDSVAFLDLSTGAKSPVSKDNSQNTCAAFHMQSNGVIMGNEQGGLELWDGKSGLDRSADRLFPRLYGIAEIKVDFTENGKNLLLQERNGREVRFSFQTGSLDPYQVFNEFSPDVVNIPVDPREQTITFDGIILHYPDKEALERLAREPQSLLRKIDRSADGELFAVVFGGNFSLFNRSGKIIKNKQIDYVTNPDDQKQIKIYAQCVKVRPDGNMLAVGSEYHTITLWDTKLRLLKVLSGHLTAVGSLAFSPNGRYLASSSVDGVVKIWNLEEETHVTLILKGDEWISYTTDGYFGASRFGGNLVAMVNDRQGYAVDQFSLWFNRPDIMLNRMGWGDDGLIVHYFSRYQRRLRRAGVSAVVLEELHTPEVSITSTKQAGKHIELSISLNDERYPLKTYNIYVNDVPVFGSGGKQITGYECDVKERLELSEGANKIEVSCVNAQGIESFRALTYAAYEGETEIDLYFIGFGVSRYRNPALNLKYADKDVLDLKELFSRMSGYYRQVYAHTYLNEDVNSESISQAKAVLKDSGPDDIVVLFISGHGLHDTDKEATYYYLVHESDPNNLAETAVEFSVIEEILQAVPPRNKLLLIDTCESGEKDIAEEESVFVSAENQGLFVRGFRGINVVAVSPAKKAPRIYLSQDNRYIYNDLVRRSGAIVFSSSGGDEYSYESDAIENGLFTEEIINCLSGDRADKDGDGFISTNELREYVADAVSRLSNSFQNPTVDRDNIFQIFQFPISDAD